MSRRFVVVGPPAMGKSTLIRLIPTVIKHATAIDLENTGFPCDQPRLKQFAKDQIGAGWRGPLFLGNAAANPIELAMLGYRVIGLHHEDHGRYLERMRKRDADEGRPDQGDHWEYHRRLFKERMPNEGIDPLIVDTISPEFDQKPVEAIRLIANQFNLELWHDFERYVT